jgi:hypothetical protein
MWFFLMLMIAVQVSWGGIATTLVVKTKLSAILCLIDSEINQQGLQIAVYVWGEVFYLNLQEINENGRVSKFATENN